MWSLGKEDMNLREKISEFRRDANQEIEHLSYHIASLNKIEIPEKIQENFLLSIQQYSAKQGASPYYLHYLLKEYNLYFIAILFSMINTTKIQEFQHRFCMLAQFLCTGCWTFADQLSFLKLVNILLTHSYHLNKLILSSQINTQQSQQKDNNTNNDNDDIKNDKNDEHAFKECQNQKFMIYHNFIQWIQNLSWPESYKVHRDNDDNKYHSHNYPDLDRKRIFQFINLIILNRPDMLYKFISFLDLALQICNETGTSYPQ